MCARSVIRAMSTGTASRTDASAEPSISQFAITSHSARWCRSSREVFSVMLTGTASAYTAASIRQKRFCGCP